MIKIIMLFPWVQKTAWAPPKHNVKAGKGEFIPHILKSPPYSAEDCRYSREQLDEA